MKKNNHFIISEEDMNCFKMLWRWKLLSSQALCVTAYGTRSIYRAYCRLLNLEKNGFIKSIGSWDQKTIAWQLNENGYDVVSSRFDATLQGGYRSENKDHDFWVSAIHLGDWIKSIPKGCDLYSEQELRKTNPVDYPEWVPQTKLHRPDGWWKIRHSNNTKDSLIALEVELSKKTKHMYNEVGDFYSNTIRPYQVIWVVKSKSDLNYILNHLKEGSLSKAEEQSFILLDHYIQHQWQSEICIGKNSGKKLSDILATSPELASNLGSGKVLLNVRKKPIISTTPRIASRPDLGFSN